jgi:hypothetical protein
VFGGFYARPDTFAGSFHAGNDARRTKQGWGVKVLWLLEPRTTHIIRLSGENLTTGESLVFQAANGSPSPSMTIDPAHPGTPERRNGWAEFPSLVSFPRAGCYVIDAAWPDGSWRQEFGFGR